MPRYDREASAGDFVFRGMKTNARPDGMEKGKFPYALNIREYADRSIVSRPPMTLIYSAPISETVFAIDAGVGISKVGTSLAANGVGIIDAGYANNQGCSLIPYRPNASPQAYDYVFDANKCTKTNGTVVSNVGIVEPQAPVEYGTAQSLFTPLATPTAGHPIAYTHAGTAGVITDTPKVADTVAAVFQDPATAGTIAEYTVQVTSQTQTYQTGEFISIGTPDVDCYQIKDVYPAFLGTVTIAAIRYYVGTTGRCVVVPYNVPPQDSAGLTQMQQNVLSCIRRGAIVKLGSEACYVLGVSIGVNGTIAFEVSTTGTHAAGTVLTGANSIKVLLSSNYAGLTPAAPTAGASISAHYAAFTVGTGVGTQTSAIGIGTPFSFQNISYRTDDYMHISILCNLYENLNEVKFLIDVADGTFTEDFYYYALRPSDIQGAIANTLTQLGAAQIAQQREIIDQESAIRGKSISSLPLFPGDGMWCDIFIPISQLQRYGTNEQLNLTNAGHFQILVNANAGVNFGFHTLDICGGYSIDTSKTGIGVKYKARPRSSITGAKGNASPEQRYDLFCRRESALVVLPTTYPDPQMDTWDVFRIGGALDQYVLAGSVPVGVNFIDDYSDLAIQDNEVLETDLYQPFPTIENPFIGQANLYGHVVVASGISGNPQANVLAYLPGNILTVGQQNYSLWTRPTLISPGVYLFLLNENAGIGTALTCNIYEPLLAAQNHAVAWGPDADGVVFSVGDTYRPGGVFNTNPNNPDAASDKNYSDLAPPTEPLIGGILNDGTSWVSSVNRWWQGYPTGNGTYNWLERDLGYGLAFPYAICSDGKAFYYVARDGVYMEGVNLTDPDLYNLFPHEGVQAPGISLLNNIEIFPPDYANGSTFRLSAANGYLFFDYKAANGAYVTLRMHIAKRSWAVDTYTDQVTCRATTTLSPTSQQMYCGSVSGAIYGENSNPTVGTGEIVPCALYTAEDMEGDLRAPKLYGDAFLDCMPASAITVFPTFLGIQFGVPTTVAASNARVQEEIDLLGGQEKLSIGLLIQWSDQGVTSALYSWQPSYIVKPEYTTDRFQDWTDCGYDGNKWIQGFLLTANTNTLPKTLTIRDSDTLTTHTFTGPSLVANEIVHDVQSTVAYSFNQPFRAHLVRYEADEVLWQEFGMQWIFQPTPEQALTWWCQPTSFGINGWLHAQRVLFTYSATATVVLTVDSGFGAQTYSLPSTGGVFMKVEQILAPYKGLVYTFSATSTAPFAVQNQDLEIMVKGWGSTDDYRREKIIGSAQGNNAKV